MNLNQEILNNAEKFMEDPENLEEVKKGKRRLEDFLDKYGFRANPDKIDNLKPEDVYNPEDGETDYFFNWIEKRLGILGRIFVWSAKPWKTAAEEIDRLKDLLKIAVDDDKSIASKIDANWEGITGFGGDKHIAKKIISVYYPKEVFPIFKTDHLETFERELGIYIEQEAKERKNKSYNNMTVGEKWELHNEILKEVKRKIPDFRDQHNAVVMKFLYETFETAASSETVSSPTPSPLPVSGPLFEPKNELGTIVLFAKYHEKLGFPFIVKISESFPDISVIDDEGEHVEIEFEYQSQNFQTHKHNPNNCDYVVCWIDNWENPPDEIEIVSLKEKLEELEIY